MNGEVSVNRKSSKTTVKSPKYIPSFTFSKAVQRTEPADSGSWAFCLRSLLHCIFEQYNPFMWCNMQCACRQTCLSSAHPSHGTFSSCM